jgi:hypothetical protein
MLSLKSSNLPISLVLDGGVFGLFFVPVIVTRSSDSNNASFNRVDDIYSWASANTISSVSIHIVVMANPIAYPQT